MGSKIQKKRSLIKKMIAAYLLIAAFILISKDQTLMQLHLIQSKLSSETIPLTGNDLKDYIGQYELKEIKLADNSERIIYSFNPFFSKRFFIQNKGEGPKDLTGMIKINKDSSTIKITNNNVCHFNWDLDITSGHGLTHENDNLFVDGIAINGKGKIFGCIRDHSTAVIPEGMTKHKEIHFKKFASYLVITAKRKQFEQTFLYQKNLTALK